MEVFLLQGETLSPITPGMRTCPKCKYVDPAVRAADRRWRAKNKKARKKEAKK
jgi:hypothetical protein